MKTLILASSSPRRRDLLKQVGIDFTTRVTDVDEHSVKTNNPTEKVQQLATLKGKSVILEEGEVSLAADTIVVYEDEILEKPKNITEAAEMIHTLSGKKHKVFTAVSIRSVHNEVHFVEKTMVEFWALTDDEIEEYVHSNEPYDKAGGYGIQGRGVLFVKQIIGDYYNVVGLPISRIARELRAFGIRPSHI